jgi:hypothetical protein
MKVDLEVVLEGKITLGVSVEVVAFTDLPKLSKKLSDHVAGVKKQLPEVANRKIEKIRIITE